MTGYWARGVPQDWEPPQELLDFLAAGPTPVYVGFGSMASRDPAGTTAGVLAAIGRAGILAAIRRAGVRALVGSGWADLRSDALPEGVHLVGDVPHGADQPYWGRRVRDLGTGPAPIPRHELGADRLTLALTEPGSPAHRSRAAELGQVIRAEDGIATAVQRLQSLAG